MLNDNQKTYLKKLRRKLHTIPEPGFLEINTANILYDELQLLDFDLKIGDEVMDSHYMLGRPSEETLNEHITYLENNGFKIEKFKDGLTGLIATKHFDQPGPTLAFRFDIDALPIKESTSDCHLPYQASFSSQNEGYMHACGHDAHMTMGIGLANLINVSDFNKGKIKLIFQPAEEGVRGALSMVKKGVVDEVDYFFATHIGLNGKSNEIITSVEGFMASTKYDLFINGESSHAGANPQDGSNAILAAATLIQQLYAIQRHENGDSRINVGKIMGGSSRNIIADKVKLEIEVRGINNEVNLFMKRRVSEIIQGVEQMFSVKISQDKVGEAPSIEPSSKLKETIYSLISKEVADLKILKEEITPSGSEDATYFIQRVQELGHEGLYLNIGSNHSFNHHHPQFDIVEQDIFNGIDVLYAIAKHFNT